MTVNSTLNRSSYAGNGVTTAFSTVFPFLSNTDLVVIERNNTTGVETQKTLTTHYTVSGGSGSSGTVTTLVAPASGVTLIIYRDPALTQLVDLVNNDALPVETAVERPLDRLTMIAQRTRELVERSLRLPEGDTGFVAADMRLPPKAVRASMLLGFDSTGKPMASAGTGGAATSAFMATVLDDTTDAEARTTLGAAAAADLTAVAADLASTSDAAKGDALIGVKQTDTSAVARTQHSKNRDYLSVMDFLSEAQRAEAISGTVTLDMTAAVQAACAALQARGGGTLDFHDYTYRIFPNTYSTTDPNGTLNIIGDFSSLDGVDLRASGAKFTSPGRFDTANVRALIFRFTNCTNITIGDFVGVYTGNRDTGTDTNAIEQRGLVFARFNDTCVNIRGGNLDVSDFSIGYHFHTDAGNALSVGSRNIKIAHVKATNTGYPLLTHRAGHGMDIHVESNACGRTAQVQDTLGPGRYYIKSKNNTASSDAGFSGDLENLDITYINTESDTGAEMGRGLSINYPTLADSPNRISRNIRINLNVKTTGATYLSRALSIGFGVGVDSADIDPQYVLEGLEVSGYIKSASSSQGMLAVDYSSAWTTGTNLDNICFKNLKMEGGGNVSLDLSSIRKNAVLQNVYSDANIQLVGNNSSKTTCINVTAPEVFSVTGNTTQGNIDFIGCNVTTASNFDLTTPTRNLVSTLLAGVLYDTESIRGQQLQCFTLQLENVAGTIKHAITCDAAGGASNFVSKVTGASTTQTTTPTGADGSTGFVSGGKISSAATNSFVFNTAAQTLANSLQIATILVNSTTTDLTVEPIFTSRDVNGTTRRRLEFLFRNATTGAAFDLTTLASGKLLYVRYLGYLS